MWEELKKGNLHGTLINHVWESYQLEDRLRLLEIMEQFDLICTAPKLPLKTNQKTRTGQIQATEMADPVSMRNYYVPSLFNPGNVKENEELSSAPSVFFFVDFDNLFTSK